MRLIDADALLAKQANIAKTFARSDAQKSLMGRVMFNAENAPTIDAVPVEWLEAHKTEYLDDWGEEPISVEAALRIWQKEQEAR